MAPPRASETLLSSMRELVSQSERVARAEARLTASRLGDLAQSGAKRGLLIVSAMTVAAAAIGFALHAIYLALAMHVVAWMAALIVAGGCTLLALMLAWAASRTELANVFDDELQLTRGGDTT